MANELAEYSDRARAMQAQAEPERIKNLNQLFEQVSTGLGEVRDGMIIYGNTIIEIGMELMAWCGHDSMSRQFWHTHCDKKLKFDYEAALQFMSIARRAEKKVNKLGEVFPLSQLMFTAVDMLEVTPRSEMQFAVNIHPLQMYLNRFTEMRGPLEKILGQEPMESWQVERLQKFLDDTEWFERRRIQAEKILKEKE